MLLKKSSTSGQPPYSDMSQLVAHNIFPPRFPADVRNMEFPWVKVEDRPWANGRFKVRPRSYTRSTLLTVIKGSSSII
jgi:hypothetical protein